MRIGVIADTHGRIDPRALTALRGVAHILHAGDIGALHVLTTLEALAPVTAVAGNVDAGTALGRRYPEVQQLEFAGVTIYMTHIGAQPAHLAAHLPDPCPDVYIFGHSHIPVLETHAGVLFLNPGAAGQPRFGQGLSVALLELAEGRAVGRIMML